MWSLTGELVQCYVLHSAFCHGCRRHRFFLHVTNHCLLPEHFWKQIWFCSSFAPRSGFFPAACSACSSIPPELLLQNVFPWLLLIQNDMMVLPIMLQFLGHFKILNSDGFLVLYNFLFLLRLSKTIFKHYKLTITRIAVMCSIVWYLLSRVLLLCYHFLSQLSASLCGFHTCLCKLC